jgi:MFS family permease
VPSAAATDGVLRRLPNFRRVWIATTVGAVGGQITIVALPLVAAILLGARAWELGVLSAAATAPYLIASLPVGVWVDRSRHCRRLVVVCDVLSGLLLLLIPVAAALDQLSMALLYLIAPLTGLTRVITAAASARIVPGILPRADLLEGYSWITASGATAQTVGPGLAGGLVALLNAPYAIAADAVSFLISARLMSQVPELPPVPAEQRSFGRELRRGQAAVFGDARLRAAVIGVATLNFAIAGILAIAVLIMTRNAGLPASAYGPLLLFLGLGALGGASVARPLARRYGVARPIVGATALCGFGCLGWAAVDDSPVWAFLVLAASLLLTGLGFTVVETCGLALVQATIPAGVRGRVGSVVDFHHPRHQTTRSALRRRTG